MNYKILLNEIFSPFFDRQRSILLKKKKRIKKKVSKRGHKSIHSIYKDGKRPKVERDTKNNILSLLRAQPINEVQHRHCIITYVHSCPPQEIIHK